MCSTSLLLRTIRNHTAERSYENYTLEQFDETICLFKLMENAMVHGAELSIPEPQAFLGQGDASASDAREGIGRLRREMGMRSPNGLSE